jgi:hypothetical protein
MIGGWLTLERYGLVSLCQEGTMSPRWGYIIKDHTKPTEVSPLRGSIHLGSHLANRGVALPGLLSLPQKPGLAPWVP